MTAKILLLDIETAPIAAWVWRVWKENIPPSMIEQDWRILTWAAKWLGDDTIYVDSIHYNCDYPSDINILRKLHAFLDEADIVIAHNGRKFDVPKINTRFLYHGMQPPSPYRTIDTLVEAKKLFSFTHNRLSYLGEFLGVGSKLDTGGFDLWNRCMHDDMDAYDEMVEYNVQDIKLLEQVYLKLRPWMKNHPNLGVYNDGEQSVCPKCGSSHINWRGYAHTQTGKFHRFQCKDCGGWGRSRYSAFSTEKNKTVVTNSQ